jgi:hypothetical protein
MTEEPAWGVRRGEKGVNALGKLEDGKRVGVVLVEPRVGKADKPTLDDVREALIAVYGTDFGVRNPTWLSRFTDMARQAASYRNQRVLLAGDAAHVHAPAGGQGLNIGVQDAVNLGWKLAQVVKGTSPDNLLDTYHAERHPIGARVLRLTMAMTALGRGDDRTEALRETMTDLLQTDAPRKRLAGTISGLDICYDLGEGHPLLGRRMPDLDLMTAKWPVTGLRPAARGEASAPQPRRARRSRQRTMGGSRQGDRRRIYWPMGITGHRRRSCSERAFDPAGRIYRLGWRANPRRASGWANPMVRTAGARIGEYAGSAAVGGGLT